MNNKVPSIHLVYDRYKKASPTAKASVELRVTYDKRQKYISTGIMLYPNQWKKGTITNCPDALQVSQILDKLISNVRQVILNMMNEGDIDIFAIPDRLRELNRPKLSFVDFCKQRASVRKYGKSEDSQERYDRFLRLFTEWGRITHFGDITEENIISYDRYLTGKGMKAYSKWNNYHRFLNSFIMDAVDAGYMKKNPYKWVNIERGKSSNGIRRSLTPEEFSRLRCIVLPTECLERVRDVFVFQTYTCLSYSDLREFDASRIEKIKGMHVYAGRREKTGKGFTVPLLEPAMEILRKYNSTLPVISNVKYNEYLKVVAQAAGIDKPVSTHWARHTGATLLLNSGIDMRIVSKICGHSSTRITEQVYAKLLDETVVDAIRKLNESNK